MINVYIVGPSCGGKTSLLHYLKAKVGESYNFPVRVVSRALRAEDDKLENEFLSHSEFERLREAQDAEFFLSWHRLMEGDRKEYYAFRHKDVVGSKTNIFSGNNALLLYPESHVPLDALKAHQSYFIACVAPDELRKERLLKRSPEYTDAEIEVRIHKESIEGYLQDVHLVIDSSMGAIEENGSKALSFLKSV